MQVAPQDTGRIPISRSCRRSQLEMKPELVALAKRLHRWNPKTGQRLSLRMIAAKLVRGQVNRVVYFAGLRPFGQNAISHSAVLGASARGKMGPVEGWQRPLNMAGAMQGLPFRVRAPHRSAASYIRAHSALSASSSREAAMVLSAAATMWGKIMSDKTTVKLAGAKATHHCAGPSRAQWVERMP